MLMFFLAGLKLFKEPSFKSNKFIIHNALSRCCLAGKVNETQKNKIAEVDLKFFTFKKITAINNYPKWTLVSYYGNFTDTYKPR